MMSRKSDSGKTSTPKSDIPWMRHALFGMVCALVIGIFAWSAEPGYLELVTPQAENDYYNLLVAGFRAGQLNVKREAPPGLAKLADPYDPTLNKSYVWDKNCLSYEMSYYKGKLYLYFGVTPALVLFWPYRILTGHYLPHKNAVVIFFAAGFSVAAVLLHAIWRRYFREVGIGVVAAGMLALGLATGMLEILSCCDVHQVAVSCSFAFTMLALAAIWYAMHSPKWKVIWILLASLAYGLAIGARPSLLFGVIILLVPVVQAQRAAFEPGLRRQVGLMLAAAVGPIVLIGVGLMLYNILRFDNPFEFGWHYQLTNYENNTARQFSLYYLGANFWFYFLEPMRWSGYFPFLHGRSLSNMPLGYYGLGAPYSGILINCPLVWLALTVPLAWKSRLAEEVSVLRWFTAAVFLLFIVCALTLCLFFAASSTYELDFLPTLTLLATIGILGLERALTGLPVWRRIARCGWCLLLADTVVFNLLASVDAHATANYIVGNSFIHQGRADEAVERFQKALALEPGSAAFHAGLGHAFSKKRQLDEAIIHYQKALEIGPDNATAHNDLGYCFLENGRVNEAMAHFQRALEIGPDSADVHNNLGSSFLRTGRLDDAIIQYQKALETKPDFAEAHNNLGYVLFLKGRVNEAISHFQRALEIKPDFAEAHYDLGYSFLQTERLDEAIVHFRTAIELQPLFLKAYDDLGNAFRRKGMAAEAMACYQRAIELQPQFPPAQINLAWMLATWPEPSVRNGGRAVALAEEANRISRDKDPQILRTLAAAYAEAGRFPEAVLTAKQALALAVSQSNTGLANELETEVGLYQTNSPCRSTNN
jgi:Tfp pilus assembly protein PilF